MNVIASFLLIYLFLDASPMPEKILVVQKAPKRKGQEITRNINALLNHILKFPSVIKGGMIASKTAAQTTKGVYTLANFVINCSVFDFLL